MFSYEDYLEESHYNVLKESINIRFYRVWHFGGRGPHQFNIRFAGYGISGSRPTSVQYSFCRVWHFGGEAHISSDQFCQVRHSGYGDIRSFLPGTALSILRYQISSARYDTPGIETSDQFCQVRHSGY